MPSAAFLERCSGHGLRLDDAANAANAAYDSRVPQQHARVFPN